MKVYVVMGNDYPHCVFSSETVAEAYCNAKTAKEKEMSDKQIRSRIYWRHYEFEVRE